MLRTSARLRGTIALALLLSNVGQKWVFQGFTDGLQETKAERKKLAKNLLTLHRTFSRYPNGHFRKTPRTAQDFAALERAEERRRKRSLRAQGHS